jgi:hypothetical protein
MVQKFSDKNDNCSFVSLFSVEFSGRVPSEVSFLQGDRMDYSDGNCLRCLEPPLMIWL